MFAFVWLYRSTISGRWTYWFFSCRWALALTICLWLWTPGNKPTLRFYMRKRSILNLINKVKYMCLCFSNFTHMLLCVLALICQGLRPVSRVHARLIESTTKITCPHHPKLWPTEMNVLTAVSHSIQSVFNTSLTTAAAFLATAFGPLVLRRVGWDVRAWSGTDNNCEGDATQPKNNT